MVCNMTMLTAAIHFPKIHETSDYSWLTESRYGTADSKPFKHGHQNPQLIQDTSKSWSADLPLNKNKSGSDTLKKQVLERKTRINLDTETNKNHSPESLLFLVFEIR